MSGGSGRPRLDDQRTWPDRAHEVLASLPGGTVDLAQALLERAERAAGTSVRPTGSSAAEAAATHLVAPLVLEPDWPPPSQPLAVGRGAIHADLTDEDHDVFARLRTVLSERPGDGELDAERLAAAAQEWRLPVTPYRLLAKPPADSGARPPSTARCSPSAGRPAGEARTVTDGTRSSDTPLVVDLSALWAGPLATSLLASNGARVVKVDSAARPDELRRHAAIHEHLNGAKETIDLDLRVDRDRRRFETLLAGADLLVDSFSRRVMANLGYGRERLDASFPHLATLSIVAFPAASDERDWVSYGPGVHAISGLGAKPDGSGFRPAPIAYPDAVAGLQAYAIATEMLSGACSRGTHAEISLAGAIAPLVAHAVSLRGARERGR